MGDAYRKLSAGASVTEFSVTAWNRMIDMLQWWKSQQSNTGATNLIRGVQQTSIFDIKNTSGDDQPWLGILGIDGPLYDPADEPDGFSRKPVLKGVEPSTDDHAGGKWGVLLDSVEDGGMCRCAVAGVVPTFVYVNSYSDTHVDVIAPETVDSDTTYLGSGSSGAQILWWEASGEDDNDTIVWAVVRLGSEVGLQRFMPKDDFGPGDTFDAYACDEDWVIAATDIRDEKTTELVDDLSCHRGVGYVDEDTPGSRIYAELVGGKMVVSKCQEQARIVYGNATSSVDSGDTTFYIENVESFDAGVLPTLDGDNELEVKNEGVKICNGAKVYAKLNVTTGDYYWDDSACCQ